MQPSSRHKIRVFAPNAVFRMIKSSPRCFLAFNTTKTYSGENLDLTC